METTKFYVVSLYNDTPYNDYYKTCNRLEADLMVSNAIKNNRYGMLIEYVITENADFNYKKETKNIIKEF